MKLSLILEAKLNRPWLEKQLGEDNPAVDKIVACDPTDGSYYAWLYKLVKSKRSDEFLTHELRANLDEWERGKQALKNIGISADLLGKDLDYFHSSIDRLRAHRALKASAQRGSGVTYMSKEYPGAEVLIDDGTFKLFKVEGTSPEAIDSLEKLGIGTEWCTRNGGVAGRAKFHLSKSPQHVLYQNGKPLYQFGKGDFKNVSDLECKPTDEVCILLANAGPKFDLSACLLPVGQPNNNGLNEDFLYRSARLTKRRWLEAEPYILKVIKVAIDYARNVIGERWPQLELAILAAPKDDVAVWARKYADEVIGDRWLEAEPYIMQDTFMAYLYAKNVIGHRWLEAEPYLVKDFTKAIDYCKLFMAGDRWPELEQNIMAEYESVSKHFSPETIKSGYLRALPSLRKVSSYADDVIRPWLNQQLTKVDERQHGESYLEWLRRCGPELITDTLLLFCNDLDRQNPSK